MLLGIFLSGRINGVALRVTMLLLFASSSAIAGIEGSVHDFSQQTWTGGEFCVVCHTPHDANTDAQAPLWNHVTSSAVYSLYTSPTMDYPTEQPTPGNPSRLCLSCHDGTVAIDSYSTNPGSTLIAERANLGTDLGNDHPVGVRWEHQTQQAGALTCTTCHPLAFNPDTGSMDFVGTPGQELKFYNRRVECPSCHDVHNVNVQGVKLLRKTLAGSALCLHCHPK